MLVLFTTFSLSTITNVNAEEKTYVIGTDVTFAPFEFQDVNGEFVGIDMDLMKA
ncbi:MAG TPA: transporter substrate-binding domain-containing protein, partial [Bacillus sp. (in: firmicutes)]|nr:transporter substrate-binding domain-containing protein [Bacillus sp. (in: firmicutes)]